MQIANVEITPVDLQLRLPYRTAYHPKGEVDRVTIVFVRVETRQGKTAWGCAAFDTDLTGETRDSVLQACHACAERAPDLNPLNTEYALEQLAPIAHETPSALCAFDLAFHDLLGLATGLPLHRLLGGFRNRIQTSVTISVAPVKETVELARDRVRQGFRILKVKGGLDPDEDVQRIRAIRKLYPNLVLRLDADQGYSVQQAIDVARALEGDMEMLEQPVPADDLDGLYQVAKHSNVPILADESVTGPASALDVATRRCADGLSIKLATCGGLRCARQIDAIARAAQMDTMVSCLNEPALLTAAGLCFALSSPNVRYGDLDGHLDLIDDPTIAGFQLKDGELIATDVPGLGCRVDL
ncbi:MAG TPA: dipeptide epimerase [Chloroflexi bacterium]|nr:dipeptide epimerase [Chloroflexota bacterium]